LFETIQSDTFEKKKYRSCVQWNKQGKKKIEQKRHDQIEKEKEGKG